MGRWRVCARPRPTRGDGPTAPRPDHYRRNWVRPLDDTVAQLLFRPVPATYERCSLAIGSYWTFDQWGRFLPEHATAVNLFDRLLHHCLVVTSGGSYRMGKLYRETEQLVSSINRETEQLVSSINSDRRTPATAARRMFPLSRTL
ncbi:MAG: ATP-binding protein [Pseudonocardiaceae bacterium]